MPAENTAQKKILIADDESMVREVLKLILTRAGYAIAEAPDGAEAVRQFAAAPDQFALVLVDRHMPGLPGQEALARMRQIDPQLKAIVFSGEMAAELEAEPAADSHTRWLDKPFDNSDLLRQVRELLAGVSP